MQTNDSKNERSSETSAQDLATTSPAAESSVTGNVTSEKGTSPVRASHDTVNPPALVAFMLKDWREASNVLPDPHKHHAAFAARRRTLSAHFPGDVLVIPTGHEKVRANDTHYRFRAGTDFYYLTGNLEPDGVLVLVPEGSGHRDVLFVQPNPGRRDPTFFTDRVNGELWVGPRMGVEQSRAHYRVDECRGLETLESMLRSDADKPMRVRVLRGLSAKTDGFVAGKEPSSDAQLATVLSEMRLKKEPMEVRALRRAIKSTHEGFNDVIAAMRNAKSEREIEGVFNLRARVEGNDVGYGTIAACGAHACTLHWTRNDGRVRADDLLLLDAGVEGDSLYTADITRTLPIGGRFSKEQKEVYELVLKAQSAAMKKVRAGNDFMEPNRAAMRVLTEGLVKMGILTMSAEEALRDENQFYKRYTLHNVSHMLGLDVHDCAKARQEAYKYGKLEPGMVLTVEPGLYFQPDDLTVPEKYRGIGVRIEDDVLVTEKGMTNLSEDIPRTVEEVESWISHEWKKARKKKS